MSISAPDSITEGAQLTYTLTRTWDPGQGRGELSVNVQLAETGDYITWPTDHQPDANDMATIPVTFAARSLTATLTLETVDDEVSEDNGSVAATILADADGSYVTGTNSAHTARLLDNDPPVISVEAVAAVVTEGTDAQFRLSRMGNTSVATRVGLWVGGLPKIMTDATEATALTADNADLTERLSVHGAWVDYIVDFAAGESEKTLSFTTEADSVNEGDGWLGVTIVQRLGNRFNIGTGYAQVHVQDDDVPTVTFSQVTLPTGSATLEGDTWVGDLGEGRALSWVVSCSGNYEYSPIHRGSSMSGLIVVAEHLLLANHPAYYRAGIGGQLGSNLLNFPSAGLCDGQTRTHASSRRFVGPDGGVETFKLVPNYSEYPIVAEYREAYRQAKAAADAAGTLITQHDIIHESSVNPPHGLSQPCDDEPRYCPQYRVGTPHKISLTLVNRNPTILIKAESTPVEEGQAARFIVERLWHDELLNIDGPPSVTVVALRASQNGQYITGALPTEITFARTETSKIIELATVDDSAFGANGSVTIELLPDTTGADLNAGGKYETPEQWSGHTPEGARSDRATIAITNNDTKPGITIAPASGPEGDSGSAEMTFTVTLATAVTEAVTVNYATSDGTAIAGQDYTAVSDGSVTIAAGETTAEFTVSMTGDETDELDETFNFTISMPEPEPNLNGGSSGEPAAAITGGDTATVAGTILDDDPAVVTVAPKVDTVEEGEEAVFVLTRAGMTDGPLAIQVRLRAPGRLEMLDARFEPGAVTAEIAVATHDNNLVDYPSVRDYTIEVFGDGEPLERDDQVFTPGTPATAIVKVNDDEELINVTVYPVKAVIAPSERVEFKLKRDGDISQPLTIKLAYFRDTPGDDTALNYWSKSTFAAGQDELTWNHGDFDPGEITPQEAARRFPIMLTYVVIGDGGWYGLNRIYQGGDPNTATVTVQYEGFERALVVGAEAPLQVSVGQTVDIPLTVTNTGSIDSGTSINITSTHYSRDSEVNGSDEPMVACLIDGPILAGESASCEVSFLVQEKNLSYRNEAEIELDVIASDGRTTSNAFRIYMRVRNGVSVGFTETNKRLEVTEPGFGKPNAEANLTVTRVGRSTEEVQVAYTLEPWPTENRPYPPVEGVDYADNSGTPGVITFEANETEKTITIDILGDQIDEEREQFRVTLVPPEGVLVEEDKKYRIVVINDATPPPGVSYRPTASLELVSADPTPENAGSVDFAVVLDRVWGKDARFEVELDAHDNLTATPAFSRLGQTGDFEAPDGLIHATIPAGQTRFEFSLTLYDDDVREEDETFQLLLSSSYDDSARTIGTPNRALATIADDDRIPPTEVALSLSRNGRVLESVDEGSSRRDITVTASFPQIRWPGDASNAPLHPADPRDVDTTVRVQVDPNSGATHAAGLDDFAPLKVEDDQGAFQEVESFDIVIPAGQTIGTATWRFKTVKDDVDEEDETVTLLGSELVAGDSEDSLPVRPASFTIIDDDTTGITISPAKLAAGTGISMKEGGTSTYSLVLDSEPTDTVTVTVAGRQGDLISLTPETLTFTPSDWSTAKTISVVSLDDGTDTSFTNAVISHQVSGGDYGSVTVREIWVQIENTTQAYIYLDDAQASESDGHLEFTVSVRPILRTVPVVVRYATVDGTAVAGSDYTREVETGQTYKMLNIPAGQSSGAIRIPIIDDQVYESADETFTLQLTNHNDKATLDGGATSLTATGAIADDDPTPVVSVAGPAGEVSYVSENAKDPVTFTLTLMGQSAGDVTVDYATGEAGLLGLLTARQGLAGATEEEDYASTSGTVTFTSGQTTKTVTVQVTDDDVSEDTEFFGFKISSPQGADLRGQRSEVVADVGLLDDDARGVTIDPTSIGLHEPASGETAVAGSYTVHLNSRPTDTVTVTIGGGDPAVSLSGATLSNTNTLTFTTSNWDTAQTVTVTPVEDDNAVGETITLTHTLSGGDYAGIAADSVTINLTDSDARNMVLSKQSLTVTEGDATGVRYTVKLAAQPSDTVTVTISGHDGADLTLTNNQLTFTTSNWGTAQTVTVKAGDDDNADDESETLAHTAFGGDYVNVTKDLPVSITDDGEVPVTVQFGATLYEVVEGAEQSVTVTLSADPERTVVIPITHTPRSGADSPADYTVQTSVTFNTGQMSKTITFTAAQDEVDDDGESVLLGFGAPLPGGVSLGTTVTTTVSITDDDEAGVVLSETGLTVTEGDAAGSSYTVTLATEPSGTVTVTISGHDGADLTLDKTTLTFTVDNWNAAQTVTVKASQDNDAANDTATLTHTASGGDYAGITADLPVTVTDDDTAGVVLSETDLTVTEGDAAGTSYTVKLATRPSGTVTVSITGHDGTDLSLSGTTLSSNMLTFAVDNWNTAQTVTVKAGEDNDGANDTGTLTHTASGGDYASITKDLPVTVTDNDEPAIVLSETDLTVTEGDAAGSSYTVKLATRPSDSVTVSITGHDGTDLSLSGTTLSSNMLTFAVDNWNTAQTVTVKAGQDSDGANDTGTLTHTASGGDYVNVTKDLPVRVTDDDTAAIVLSETDLTVTEGDAAGSSYTVRLATQPSGTVTVSITGHDGTDLSLSGTTLSSNMLTFAVDNWNTAQTVTVKAGQDSDGANDTGTLTHTASGGDYASITKDLPVTVTDDDCGDVDIWCATMKFNATVHWEGRYDLYTAEVDNREFSHNGADYQLLEITVPQNGHDSGDDNHVVLPFGIPERTHFLIDFLNLSGTSDQVLEPPNNDWLDWTLHVSTVSDGETLTATLRFSEARKLAGAWWRWSGGDIDDLRRAWKEGQPYKLRLVEDPRSERTPQPLNPPLYLRVKGEEDGGRTQLYWLTPQTRNDRVPPVDSYKIQWKQSSGSWDTATAVSETTRGHSSQRPVSHFLDGLTPGVEYNIRVIATDSVGDSEPSNEITYTKPASGQHALSNTPADGEPRINGIPEVGQTLSVDTTTIEDVDGLDHVVFQYQWLADDADIAGSTGATYTVVSGDVGKAIRVRVAFADDGGNEETLTSAPTVVTAAGLQLQSATVDGVTLTLTYSEVLDNGGTLGTTPFAVRVNGSSRSLSGVAVGGSNVLLLLSSVVEAGDTVTVDYTAPNGPDFIRDTLGRKAASFSGQAVTNDTASAGTSRQVEPQDESNRLTASVSGEPSSHDGQTAFTFELRFSEDPKPDFSYTTVRDYAFTVTGGSVTYVRRLEPGKNVRWEINVTPASHADVAIDLNATTDCSAKGAICTEGGGKLSGGLLLVVPGPNTPATGLPTITGTAQVGETLTADTAGISDDDGLDDATFAYQWLADDAEINGATASTYTLADADAGKAIKVKVTFTDDGDNEESLTSAATGAVVAAVVRPPLTASAHDVPSSHDGSSTFTFELRFSEEFPLSYVTLRDHAFTVDGGTMKKAERITKGSNVRWRITVEPDGDVRVIITLPVSEGCDAQGAICTEDGRPLSNRLELTVSGPGQ